MKKFSLKQSKISIASISSNAKRRDFSTAPNNPLKCHLIFTSMNEREQFLLYICLVKSVTTILLLNKMCCHCGFSCSYGLRKGKQQPIPQTSK